MKPDQLQRAGERLYGRKGWRIKLAKALDLNPATIWRMQQRESIPGPVEVAVRGLLQNKRANDLIRKLARQTEPKLEKKRTKKPRAKLTRPYRRKHVEATVDSVTRELAKRFARAKPGHAASGVPDGERAVPDPVSQSAGGADPDWQERDT